MSSSEQRYRAGETLDDYCRACKLVRRHTVMVAGTGGEPLRVVCDYCKSQHNYRGGARPPEAGTTRALPAGSAAAHGTPFPLVDPRERSGPPMSSDATGEDLELLLRRVIREEAGLTPVVPAEKWRGGELVLRPGRAGLQEKSWPIETFFHKVVMLRNRLRTLEQQVNASDLPEDQKLKLQSYVTGCYGSLTSFNVLFAAEEDQFRGAAGKDEG